MREKKKQGAAAGRAQCRCTKNRGQRGGAAAPEGRTWPPTAPTCAFVEEKSRRRGSRDFTAPRGANGSGEAKGVAGIFALVISSAAFCSSMKP